MLHPKWEVADELTGNGKSFTKKVIFFSFLVPTRVQTIERLSLDIFFLKGKTEV